MVIGDTETHQGGVTKVLLYLKFYFCDVCKCTMNMP